MRVLILGGSGGVGKQLVDQAVQRGHIVTVLVRPSSKETFAAGVKVIKGEATDPAVVAQAVAGQEVILSGLGHRMPNLFPWSHPQPYMAEAFKLVCAEALKAGVKKISAVSAAGVKDSWNHVPFLYRTILTVSALRHIQPLLKEFEDVVAGSGIDYQLVRPVLLTEGPKTDKPARVVIDAPIDQISRADVASFMLDQVEKEGKFTVNTPLIVHGE